MHDPTDLRAIQDRENDARHEQAKARREEAELWSWMMSGAKGRRFINLLLDRCGHGRSSFTSNAMTMAFAEGRKSVAYDLDNEARRHAPTEYIQMVGERT